MKELTVEVKRCDSVPGDGAAAQLSDGKSASALLSVQRGGSAPVHVAA